MRALGLRLLVSARGGEGARARERPLESASARGRAGGRAGAARAAGAGASAAGRASLPPPPPPPPPAAAGRPRRRAGAAAQSRRRARARACAPLARARAQRSRWLALACGRRAGDHRGLPLRDRSEQAERRRGQLRSARALAVAAEPAIVAAVAPRPLRADGRAPQPLARGARARVIHARSRRMLARAPAQHGQLAGALAPPCLSALSRSDWRVDARSPRPARRRPLALPCSSALALDPPARLPVAARLPAAHFSRSEFPAPLTAPRAPYRRSAGSALTSAPRPRSSRRSGSTQPMVYATLRSMPRAAARGAAAEIPRGAAQ